jgi:hypothetical protein
LTSVLAGAPTTGANAATLYTPPLWLELDGGVGVREVANVGEKELIARVRAVNAAGSVAADSGDVPVQPAQIRTLLVDIGLDGNDQIYCRFDVSSPKSKVRASACIKNGDDRLACLEGR